MSITRCRRGGERCDRFSRRRGAFSDAMRQALTSCTRLRAAPRAFVAHCRAAKRDTVVAALEMVGERSEVMLEPPTRAAVGAAARRSRCRRAPRSVPPRAGSSHSRFLSRRRARRPVKAAPQCQLGRTLEAGRALPGRREGSSWMCARFSSLMAPSWWPCSQQLLHQRRTARAPLVRHTQPPEAVVVR